MNLRVVSHSFCRVSSLATDMSFVQVVPSGGLISRRPFRLRELKHCESWAWDPGLSCVLVAGRLFCKGSCRAHTLLAESIGNADSKFASSASGRGVL
eukprot:1418269-Rhodomonas_salina.2